MNLLKAANPVTVTKGVVGVAGTAVGVAGVVARETVHAPVALTRVGLGLAGAAAGLAGAVARETAHGLRTDRGEHPGGAPVTGAATDAVAGSPPGPTVVTDEPHAPQEPPVDVVGRALAAEAAADRLGGVEGAGLAHEPHGASRDEEHGAARLQRAEVEEIAEEARAELEGDLEPEEHLAEPLLDPADAKAMAAELETMSRAADPDQA